MTRQLSMAVQICPGRSGESEQKQGVERVKDLAAGVAEPVAGWTCCGDWKPGSVPGLS